VDTDKDGLTDEVDPCPGDKEDVDGVQDTDGCPDPTAALAIHLRTISGDPIPGLTLRVEGYDHLTAQGADATLQAHPGRYSLTAEAAGYESLTSSFEVKPDGSTVVNRTMDAINRTMSNLRIVVTDATGTALDCSLSMDGASGVPLSAGKFTALVVPGKHVFVINAPGFQPFSTAVSLEAGKERVMGVTLFPAQ